MNRHDASGRLKSENAFGDHATRPVPRAERKGFLNVSTTTGAWIITMSTFYTGGVLAHGLPFAKAMVATALGMMILAGYGFFQGWMGARYGVSSSLLARQMFGGQGGKLFAVVVAFILGIGWFGWQLSFFGRTVAAFLGDSLWGEPKVAMTWGAVLMIGSAFIGYRALSRLSLFAVPLIVLLSIWGVFLAVDQAAGWPNLVASRPLGEPISMARAISVVVGNGAIGAVVFPDLTRFSKSGLQGGLATGVGYFCGGVFLIVAGAVISYAANAPDGDLPLAMKQLGIGLYGFLILLFAQWTTNNNNLYSGSLALAAVVGGHKQWIALGMGLLGLAIALIGIQDFFVPILIVLGTYIPPVAGVMIADNWIVRPLILKVPYEFPALPADSGINLLALAAILAAGFLGGAIDLGIPPLNAVLLGFCMYGSGAYLLRHRESAFSFGKAAGS